MEDGELFLLGFLAGLGTVCIEEVLSRYLYRTSTYGASIMVNQLETGNTYPLIFAETKDGSPITGTVTSASLSTSDPAASVALDSNGNYAITVSSNFTGDTVTVQGTLTFATSDGASHTVPVTATVPVAPPEFAATITFGDAEAAPATAAPSVVHGNGVTPAADQAPVTEPLSGSLTQPATGAIPDPTGM